MQRYNFFTEKKLIVVLLIISLFLSLNHLHQLMTFIGDQAWFYLSARDMLLGHSIPLVGITSSHTWLHQGPLWTYLLAMALWLGNFNPVAGAYLSIGIHLVTVVVLYRVSKRMFSNKVAYIATILYAASPLVLFHARMPYHTSPIPLFTLLYFFSLFQWVKGKKIYFSLSFLFLAILYNFELATVVLTAPLILIILYGLLKKKKYIKNLRTKDFLQGILLTALPMIPVLIYDTTHGFKQTVVYAGWLVMNALRTLGISIYPVHIPEQSINIFYFTYDLLEKLVFLPQGIIALLILVISVLYVLNKLYKQYQKRSPNIGLLFCFFWFVQTTLFYFGNRTPSEAYLPMLFPVVFLLIAYFLSNVIKSTKLLVVIIGITVILNVTYFINDDYLTKKSAGLTLQDRQIAVKRIISEVNDQPYNLIGKGNGSQFESFLMPYEYLSWYSGHPPTKTKQKYTFILEEKGAKVEITKKL